MYDHRLRLTIESLYVNNITSKLAFDDKKKKLTLSKPVHLLYDK